MSKLPSLIIFSSNRREVYLVSTFTVHVTRPALTGLIEALSKMATGGKSFGALCRLPTTAGAAARLERNWQNALPISAFAALASQRYYYTMS